MNKQAIPLFLLSTACSFFCFAPYAHSAESNETWWITPRYGFSTSTGMIGVELQIDNFALAAGVIPPMLSGCDAIDTYAIKYYVNSTGDSWSLGIFSMGLCNRINGISADYRWRWTRWDLSAGLGLGSDGKTIGPVPSFSVGYSF